MLSWLCLGFLATAVNLACLLTLVQMSLTQKFEKDGILLAHSARELKRSSKDDRKEIGPDLLARFTESRVLGAR